MGVWFQPKNVPEETFLIEQSFYFNTLNGSEFIKKFDQRQECKTSSNA